MLTSLLVRRVELIGFQVFYTLDQQYPDAVTPSSLVTALLAHLRLNHPEAAAGLLSQQTKLAQSWTDAEQQQVHQAALDLLKSHPTTAAAAFGSTICQDAFDRESSNAAVQHSQLVKTCLAAGMLDCAVEVRQGARQAQAILYTAGSRVVADIAVLTLSSSLLGTLLMCLS